MPNPASNSIPGPETVSETSNMHPTTPSTSQTPDNNRIPSSLTGPYSEDNIEEDESGAEEEEVSETFRSWQMSRMMNLR